MKQLEIFNNNESEYLLWTHKNPNGFVVNTGKGKNSSHFVLHRANCNSISFSLGNISKGNYTSGASRKICSNNFNSLKSWFTNHYPKFKGNFAECPICNPFTRKIINTNNLLS